jgi:hypothetical protein
VNAKTKQDKKELSLIILPQKNDFWKNLNKNIFDLPLIFVDNATCLYYLASDIDDELASFINTGRTNNNEFRVFPKEREETLVKHWTQLGLITTYHIQKIDYMHHRVSITYLKIRNHETGVSISILPWFMLPGRPFPVFIYIYAAWHYHSTNKKSLSQTTAATKKVFGLEGLDKSTVSRNIKAFENIIDASRINKPLTIEQPELSYNNSLSMLVSEIVCNTSSIESLKERYKEMIKQLPEPINRAETVAVVLSGIPSEYSKVIKSEEVIREKTRDTRKRPPRTRRKGTERVQRSPKFVSFRQLEHRRRGFIEICRCLVLDAAVSYHRFLV